VPHETELSRLHNQKPYQIKDEFDPVKPDGESGFTGFNSRNEWLIRRKPGSVDPNPLDPTIRRFRPNPRKLNRELESLYSNGKLWSSFVFWDKCLVPNFNFESNAKL